MAAKRKLSSAVHKCRGPQGLRPIAPRWRAPYHRGLGTCRSGSSDGLLDLVLDPEALGVRQAVRVVLLDRELEQRGGAVAIEVTMRADQRECFPGLCRIRHDLVAE